MPWNGLGSLQDVGLHKTPSTSELSSADRTKSDLIKIPTGAAEIRPLPATGSHPFPSRRGESSGEAGIGRPSVPEAPETNLLKAGS